MSWQIRFSNSKSLPYFYNASTHTSVWEAPAELSQAEIEALPGAELLRGPPAPKKEEGKVRASHLLVKHRESRRASSWKEANITRSPSEAEAILREHQRALTGGSGAPSVEEFAKLASVHSDCSSARSGGDLGFFGRGQMQRPFEEATYALQVGQMSDVVSTDSGLHLILRTA